MNRFGFVVVALTLAGCLPPKFPSDVLAIYDCVQTQVEAGNTNVGAIALACVAPEEQLVIDAIDALLQSKSWTAAHPGLVPPLRSTLAMHSTPPAKVAP